jgi:hypothetical protein
LLHWNNGCFCQLPGVFAVHVMFTVEVYVMVGPVTRLGGCKLPSILWFCRIFIPGLRAAGSSLSSESYFFGAAFFH